MSAQFGRLNWHRQQVLRSHVDPALSLLTSYGPDGCSTYASPGLLIRYTAFCTTKESREESQPRISVSGAVVTWDGRLDNRAELVEALRDCVELSSPDVAIVAAAFDRWDVAAFSRLIGDWALSIWNPANRQLLLAKDPVGARHLYYAFDEYGITWSSILQPLIACTPSLSINEEYIAGWLATLFPAVHLTPYKEIHAVPPASFVRFCERSKAVINRYWDFNPRKRIRYSRDVEYEEHFRSVFTTAVQRRLRSERPVLAELSGGMDSSAIVCVADDLITKGSAETVSLETISWYDDSYDDIQADWNEFPYITKVEERRGKRGYHIRLGDLTRSACDAGDGFHFADHHLSPTPNARNLSPLLSVYAAHVNSEGYRVTLSGIGGGEATGDGVPSPVPEFQDLLTRLRLVKLTHQLKAWSEKMRTPQLPLLWSSIREFILGCQPQLSRDQLRTSCLERAFIRQNNLYSLQGAHRIRFLGPLPSFQHALNVLEGDRRVLAHSSPSSEFLREIRYPYLDRDFLEFMFAIPREQIVRVGQRRSLMKRAMAGIIPHELLGRKRRAFTRKRNIKTVVQESWITEMSEPLLSGNLGIVNRERLLALLQLSLHQNQDMGELLKRSVGLEFWLRHLLRRGMLVSAHACATGGSVPSSGFIGSTPRMSTSSTS